MWQFIFGCIVGCIVGIFLLALISAVPDPEEREDNDKN